MKKYLIIIALIFCLPLHCWSQGQITRPKKTEPANKETPKQTAKQNQTTSTLPNSTETINGITVHWNGVTQNQKSVITNLLNNMVYVQGGSFMMGANDSDAYNNEKPVHQETVSSFRIDKYEVTQKLWTAIMGSNPSFFKGENHPVEQVSWNDCRKFIRMLNRLTGLNFRLPTESEWEYAARGGNKTNGFKFSGSNTIDDVAWFSGNSDLKTHDVGEKKPNELDLFDMTGNVEEWTSDRFSPDYNSIRNSDNYISRGGCVLDNYQHPRVTSRNNHQMNIRNVYLGFRLVL